MANEYLVGNRGGIVYVAATQVSAGGAATNAVYSLPNHTFRYLGPVGLMVVNVATGTSTVAGLTVKVNNQELTATDNEGGLVTTIPVGDHILFFNKANNTIKMFL